MEIVAHQITSSVSAVGGPTYTIPALCKALTEHGVKVTLHTLGPAGAHTSHGYEFRSHQQSRFISRLGLSSSLRKALSAALDDANIMHGHLLWMMPTIYPAFVRRQRPNDCHLVMSPRGTLDPWDFNNHKLQKRIAWYIGQRLNLASSACLHATAPMERDHFRNLGLRPPIAVIPNGVDIPDLAEYPRTESPRRRMLFFSRIHPKKGLDILIRAWRNVQATAGDWDLLVAGNPSGSYLKEMQKLAESLGAERIFFHCPASSEEKWRLYRNADLFVLPTRGDNWGIAIADALSFGIPAIVSKEAPWNGLETHRCGWWLDLSVDAFTDCLRSVLNHDSKHLSEMGMRGRGWMAREFSWTSVGLKMEATYRWIVKGGTRPGWVDL